MLAFIFYSIFYSQIGATYYMARRSNLKKNLSPFSSKLVEVMLHSCEIVDFHEEQISTFFVCFCKCNT